MNDEQIETLLRKAPRPAAPAELLEKLQADIAVPRQTETALVSRAEAAPLQNGRRVYVGIRPHKIVVAPGGNGAVERVTGTVVSSEWLGDQSYLGVEIGDAFLIVVADRSINAPDESQITLGLPYEALHFYDSDSGEAVLHGSDLLRA